MLFATMTNAGNRGRQIWQRADNDGSWPYINDWSFVDLNTTCLRETARDLRACYTRGSHPPTDAVTELRGIDGDQSIVWVTVVDGIGTNNPLMRGREAHRYFPGMTRTTAAAAHGWRDTSQPNATRCTNGNTEANRALLHRCLM